MINIKLLLYSLTFAALFAAGACQRRILNGQDAHYGQFPYIVSLQTDGRHFCGGSIINNKWILTAAHCVNGTSRTEITILAGITKLNDERGQRFRVSKIVVHDSYNKKVQNDISLIKVKGSINFSDTIQPINISSEIIGRHVRVTVSGWGWTAYSVVRPNVLQFVHLKTLSNKQCMDKYKSLDPFPYIVTDSMMCTSAHQIKGPWKGDSGGPLVSKNKLVGIASCGVPFMPMVYTRAASFIGWIHKHTK